jgi:glycosyltransferase involved in cell wall biosynthesis
LYQAMMVGKPLLVSSSTPLKRVVTAANSGLVFEADNAKDFSQKVLELYQNETLCKSLGKNGLHATIEGDMNWESEQSKLTNFYAGVQKEISSIKKL